MNPKLSIHTLGGVKVEIGQTPVTKWQSRKAEALLVYLAATRRTYERESLIGLLWADMPQDRALANLSVMLSNIRKNVGADFLVADRQQVGLDWGQPIWVDADAFATKMGELLGGESPTRHKLAQLEKNLGLYKGDFLQGYYIRGAQEFEEWGLFEQERLRQLAINGWQALVSGYLQRGEGNGRVAIGISHAKHLLTLDPLRENTHRDLMQLYALADQRSAALDQYEKCRQILEDELGVEPEAETVALAEAIKQGDKKAIGREDSRPLAPLSPSPPLSNLPTLITPFVGRQTELRQIQRRLEDPNCRLLTLLGLGGSGKTRLGLAVGEATRSQYLNGVWFVPLANIDVTDTDTTIVENLLLAAIANALPFSFSQQGSLANELTDYLRNRELLLILDNFEHFLAGRGLLIQLLANAPDLKILVTSRERLTLHGEYVFALEGLTLPDTTNPREFLESDAVRLFTEAAHRVRPDFLPQNNPIAVQKICQLVFGLPLALELAASWLPLYSTQQIATEIEKSLTFLQATHQDLPTRHRSLRAVFDHSWYLLSDQEQKAFMKLGVFRGGFTVEAVGEIAGISPQQLLGLLNKSLIQRTSPHRFSLHELLRQFATDKLVDAESIHQDTRQKHARYFSHLVKKEEQNVYGSKVAEGIERLVTDFDNVRRAWRWGVQHANVEIFQRMWNTLLIALDIRGLYSEAIEMTQGAIAALEPISLQDPPQKKITYGEVLGGSGAFYFRVGEYEKCADIANRAVAILAPFRPHYTYGHALLYAGVAAYPFGELDKVIRYWQEATIAYEEADFLWGVSAAQNNSAEINLAMGNVSMAQQQAKRALQIAERLDNDYHITASYSVLGSAALQQQDFSEARFYLEASIQSARRINYDGNVSVGLSLLAQISAKEGNYEQAKRLFAEGIELLRKSNNRLYLMSRLDDLAEVAMDFADWRTVYEAGLEILVDCQQTGVLYLGMSSLVRLAKLYQHFDLTHVSYLLLEFAVLQGGDLPEKGEAEKLIGVLEEMPAFSPPNPPHPTHLSHIILELRRHPVY